MRTVVAFLRSQRHDLDQVRMVLYTREDETAFVVFASALEKILLGDVQVGEMK
jgi:hypothetical protein